MTKRKYGIAAILAQYDRTTQRTIIADLAVKLDISEQMLSLYINATEKNKHYNLTLERAAAIAKELNVDINDILTIVSNEVQTN